MLSHKKKRCNENAYAKIIKINDLMKGKIDEKNIIVKHRRSYSLRL